MSESKILITNFPNLYQRPTMSALQDAKETINVVCGYDFQIDNKEVEVQIARDFITALLSFDQIYVEGNHLGEIIQVIGPESLKELLRLHILCIVPDQGLNPVMIQEGGGEWQHSFISYPLRDYKSTIGGRLYDGGPYKWSHIEYSLHKLGIKAVEANTILYLVEENSADIGDSNLFIKKVNDETSRDIIAPEFLSDPNFYRKRSDGKWEYNQVGRVRIQELNKSAILAETLGISNIKMDAAINELMLRKTLSAFSKKFDCGTDVLLKIEQQKGFPDLGELFVKKIVRLDEILELKNNYQGKIFRYWAHQSKYDENLMRQEIMNSVNNLLGSRLSNPLRIIGCNLIGLLGFMPGIAASAFDSYILDAVSKGWHPNFFLDDKLKAMIDTCVAKDTKSAQRRLRDETFKGIGRNDLCPFGSGKKFKKCHGRD